MNTKLFIPYDSSEQGIEYKTSDFPSGEGYVKLMVPGEITGPVDIHFRWQGDKSLIQLFNLVSALRFKNATEINLFSAYFPGCRSDRVNHQNEGEALSSQVYAELVNSQKFNRVTVFDPHSDVVPAILHRRRVVNNHTFVRGILKDLNCDYCFVSPDAGATKKIDDLALACCEAHHRVIRADKKRDVITGKLVPGKCVVYDTDGHIKGRVCIIVDDICSRGGTFIALSKELKALGASSVILIVSHYEGCADENALKAAGIDRVFTTTSLIEPNAPDAYVHTTSIASLL